MSGPSSLDSGDGMQSISLPSGTVVHIQGIPFVLVRRTILKSHPANVEMVTMPVENYAAHMLKTAVENMSRTRWQRWLKRFL